jgi:thiamine-monophosphate kinase
MGGIPKYFTLSVALPGDLEISWIDFFLDGLARACKDFNVTLLGGDSSSAERIFADVSMIGWIETGKEVRRSGAKPGDGVYVTGTLGASAQGLDELRAGNFNHPSVARHLYPIPRHEIGRVIASMADAMMDISDGLSTDLHHIIEESNVSARIDKNRIPAAEGVNDAQILHGGEDYELLIVARDLPKIFEGVTITRIGEITSAAGNPQIVLVDESTESLLEPRGYEHFRITPEIPDPPQ